MINLKTLMKEYKERVDQELAERLARYDADQEIKDAIAYSLLGSGKRLRPILMLRTAKMLGIPEEQVMSMACALEMIHTYSLVHDDLPALDNDTLRRGKATSHVVYGEANAILIGDSLLNLATETALDMVNTDKLYNYMQAVRYLFRCSGIHGMIGGQWLDIKYTGSFKSESELENMHLKKTGALFFAACLCPAIIIGLSEDERIDLETYTRSFGLLFQITDDILDITGHEELLGKTIGKDNSSQKSTYVSILGLDQSIKLAQTIAMTARASLERYGQDSDYHVQLVDFVLKRKH